ncbi:GntR family transcriptional regulator [Telmatospirillum siberiense]|nr:GntR family transcriptional regulator [Telmatospirillum siberiense]
MDIDHPEVNVLQAEFRALPDVLYQSLRESILNGSLPPGSELRQELIAKQFGVSRVPVREALSRLQAEGLIILRPRRGFAVTSLDLAEIIEVFELRMVLEQHALETATRLRTESDVLAVEALLTAMESLDPQAEGYLPAWLDVNREFHNRLIASARRQRLSTLTINLRDTIEPYVRIESYFTGQVDDAAAEHRALFAAFKDRDATRAGEISRDHCLGSMNRLVDSIRRHGLSPVMMTPKKSRRAR